ncbi:cytochrome P450 4V2 [Armadillidium vulgare]|nr:cytochrome P450 4V2 [Armadillidium vulgare]
MTWIDFQLRMDSYTNIIAILYTTFTILVCIWSYLFVSRQKRLSVINSIPGPKSIPVLGNALDLLGGQTAFFETFFNKFCAYPGGLSRIWIGFTPYCLIYSAKGAEVLLNNPKYLDKTVDYEAMQPWLGTGLLTSSETAMGSNINVQETPNLDYVESIYEHLPQSPLLKLFSLFRMGRLVTDRQSRPWLQIGFVFKLLGYARRQEKCLKILHSFALEVIKERRRERNMVRMNKNELDDDVLGAFLTEYTKNLIVSLGNSERVATPSDIREMKYLECCIKESLRLFPSVPVFGRGLKEDLVIDGHVVPKGTNAIVLTYRLHRDPEHFPEPNSFRPERFLSENSCQKFAMLEEKVVLSTFLRKFRVESQEKMSDLKLTLNLILKPEKETLVKIFSRK